MTGLIKCIAFLGILKIGDLLLQRIDLVQDGLVAGFGFYSAADARDVVTSANRVVGRFRATLE